MNRRQRYFMFRSLLEEINIEYNNEIYKLKIDHEDFTIIRNEEYQRLINAGMSESDIDEELYEAKYNVSCTIDEYETEQLLMHWQI